MIPTLAAVLFSTAVGILVAIVALILVDFFVYFGTMAVDRANLGEYEAGRGRRRLIAWIVALIVAEVVVLLAGIASAVVWLLTNH